MKSPSSHENAACEGPEVDLSGLTPEQQQQAVTPSRLTTKILGALNNYR